MHSAEAAWGDQKMLLTREKLVSWTLIAAAVIFVALSIALALPFVPALTWAVVLAVLGRPLHDWLKQHIRNQNVAAIFSVVVIAIVILGPLIWISVQVSEEVQSGIRQIQSSVRSGAFAAEMDRHPKWIRAYDWLNDRVDLAGAGGEIVKALQPRLAHLVGDTIGAIVQGVICLFALFFFLRDRREIAQTLRTRLPLAEDEIRTVVERLKKTVRAVVLGRMLVALIQGALGGVMFWILGLEAALVWGVAMAILGMIPAVGAVFIWAPAAVWLAITGHWVKAIILGAWGGAVVGTIDNFLYPLFVGRDVRVHTLVLFFALLGGVLLFGATGLVLGPVIVETAWSLLDILRARTRAGSSVEQPG